MKSGDLNSHKPLWLNKAIIQATVLNTVLSRIFGREGTKGTETWPEKKSEDVKTKPGLLVQAGDETSSLGYSNKCSELGSRAYGGSDRPQG